MAWKELYILLYVTQLSLVVYYHLMNK